jgi:hypothetical protein
MISPHVLLPELGLEKDSSHVAPAVLKYVPGDPPPLQKQE